MEKNCRAYFMLFRSLEKVKLKAFTLSELLVVLVIIGILVLLALPKLMPLITKTRTLEAKQALKHIHTLQKTYFFEHSKFSSSLTAIQFEQEKLVTDEEAGTANYQIEIVNASAKTFVARATAVVDFDGDGVFNIWETNETGVLNEVQND